MTPAVVGYPRPENKKLAAIFDDAISRGYEIRYADERRLSVYRKNQWGCFGILLLILIGILTVFIVPIILFILGVISPGGQVITYTLTDSGQVKKRSRSAR